MKKFIARILPLCVIVIVILLILVGLRSIDGDGTVPSYGFLGGRNPVACENGKTEFTDKRYTYSFEADYNDLCSKADAELIPAGFVGSTIVDDTVVDKTFSDIMSSFRVYYLKGRFPRGSICIYIYKNRQCIKLPNSNDYARADKDGWVMVEVVYGRWRWPF